jgi:hypothetical protein
MRLKVLVIIFSALFVAMPARTAGEFVVDTDERVVAFGDVHGAFEDWTALLQQVGVIDDKFDWVGGRTHLVSLGDLVDRGPGSREVVELMMKLQGQARESGGAVHMVLGNHEVMVMTGDLRYVSPEEFRAFAADESQAERDALFAEYRRFNTGGEDAEVRAAFDVQYPPGFLALRRAYSLGGELGSWLAQQPFVLKVNDKVYMHAGIAAEASAMSLDELNLTLQAELHGFLQNMDALREAGVMPWHVGYQDRLNFLNARADEFVAAYPEERAAWFDPLIAVFDAQKALLFNLDSPNWYRGTAVCHPFSESFNTEKFLKRAGAEQLVIGHTPTTGQAQVRMDGLTLRLDTGVLRSVYGGRAAALVSEGGRDEVHYLGSDQATGPVPEQRELAMQLSGMSDAELEDFMRTAPVVDIQDIGTGITKPKRVTQERNGMRNDAVFKYEDTHPGLQDRSTYISRRFNEADRYVYDVAAYKLDRILDLQMVPTSVLATVDGDDGALSDGVENAVNERDRLEQNLPFGGYCDQWEQYRLRFIYDILIYNEDRNLTNILWTKDDYMLRFIDHTLEFRSTEKRPRQYRKMTLELSDLLRARLEGLNEAVLQRELGDYLHPRQIEAILARRDLILKEAVGTDP